MSVSWNDLLNKPVSPSQCVVRFGERLEELKDEKEANRQFYKDRAEYMAELRLIDNWGIRFNWIVLGGCAVIIIILLFAFARN